jgi:hypothetical protein
MSGRDCGGRRIPLVERMFTGALPRWRRPRVRRHLVDCPVCRTHYDRLALVDAQLGRGTPLSRAGLDAIEDAVLGSVAATPWHRRPSLWIGLGAAATAVALLVVLRTSDDGLRERGGGAGGRTPGVRVFCTRGIGDLAYVAADGRVASIAHPAPAITCRLEDTLQLAYTTPSGEGLTMVAFARRADSVLYYAPRPGDTTSVAVLADRVDESLPWSTRLAVRHEVGSYELVIRFYDRPVLVSEETATPLVELRGRLVVTP